MTIILSLVAVLNVLLGIVVFLRNKRSLTNRTFAGLTFCLAIWSITIALSWLPDIVGNIDFWSNSTFIGPSFLIAFLVYFVLIFKKIKVQISKFLSVIIFGMPTILLLLAVTKNINKKTINPWTIERGFGIYIFEAFFIFGLVFSLYKLITNYRQSNGVLKLQIKYILFGILFAAISGIIFNLVLPLAANNARLTQIGPPITGLVFISFIAYAITKHRLLDIRLVILRTITYSLIVLIISAFIVSVGVYIPQLVDNIRYQTLVGIAVSILIVTTIDHIKHYISRVTDKLFFKATINYDKALQQLSEIINKEIDLNKLLGEVSSRLNSDLKIQSARILLPDEGGTVFVQEKSDGVKETVLDPTSSLVRYLGREKRIVVLEALERRIEDTTNADDRAELERSKAELDKLNAAVLSPVITEGRIAAILVLGGKLSGDPFSNDDLNLLQLLGPQLASALEKARLYEEIRLFNVKLQKEVEIATERVKQKNIQLEDRNRYLGAVQKVTNLITQTLEFKKVTQSIVDAISTELGFVGGILLFLGESRHKVFPEAITNTPITSKVLKLLPKPVNEYWGDYTTDRTLNIEAMKNNQVRISTRLADFISPPVPAIACGAIQKLAGIKTIVSVPIFTENEVVGCIDFMIAKEPHQITKTEHDMMQAMANQTAVVYRNIELVRRLEGSNRELGEANEHLKELDQAKSEFVSIASHQLRTPMTGIMGYLSMIVGGDFGKVDTELAGILQKLLDESQRMIQLINVFLDVTKIESGKLVLDKLPMHVEDIADKVVSVLQKSATNKKLKLSYARPNAPLPVLMIDQKITDVLQNLVDNAIKYTEQGSITITTEVEVDQVHVRVKDTGRGLDPKEAKNLFNKFVRGYGIAQVNPDGSGLGLYIARRIIEVHGGKIWVESDGVGKGSTFQFTLPIKPVDAKFEPVGAAKVSSPKPVVG